jgi:hypothetical protein
MRAMPSSNPMPLSNLPPFSNLLRARALLSLAIRCAVAGTWLTAMLHGQSGVTIVTTSLPSATAGAPYAATVTVSGGVSPFLWFVTGGALPPGFQISPTGGVISGITPSAGTYSFTLTVADSKNSSAAKTLSITVTNPVVTTPPLQITTVPPLFNGQAGTAYSQAFSASGGAPPYTWSIASGSTGDLALDAASGVLKGTPQSAGTLSFVVKAVDGAGASVSQSYTLTVNPPSLTITAGAPLPSGTVAVAYDQKFSVAASGGTPPYTWSLSNGSVPGLTFSAAAIEISGTPATAGTFPLTLQATDAAGVTATRAFSLTIAPSALTITTARQLSNGALNVPFSQPLAAVGGNPPFTWAANGLPAGLTINSSTGLISGTPTAAGNFTPVITVSDAPPALNHFSDNFALTVNLPSLPPVTISGLSNTAGAAQQFPLQVSLGSTYAAAIKGQLILSFQANSGPSDSTIQFSTGGRTASFTVPLGGTAAIFTDSNGSPVSQLQVQTGTAAGTVFVSLSNLNAGGADITPTPAPSLVTQIAAAAPVITGIQVIRNADTFTGCKQGQICIQVTGYSTAREVTQAAFSFSAASGQTLQSSAGAIPVDVGSLFGSWFSTSVMGSQFIFVQPFTVTGDPAAVVPVSVTLTNRTGSVTANVNP